MVIQSSKKPELSSKSSETFCRIGRTKEFSWDEKNAGVQMLMYELTGKDEYETMIQHSLQRRLPGGSVPYTPKG